MNIMHFKKKRTVYSIVLWMVIFTFLITTLTSVRTDSAENFEMGMYEASLESLLSSRRFVVDTLTARHTDEIDYSDNPYAIFNEVSGKYMYQLVYEEYTDDEGTVSFDSWVRFYQVMLLGEGIVKSEVSDLLTDIASSFQQVYFSLTETKKENNEVGEMLMEFLLPKKSPYELAIEDIRSKYPTIDESYINDLSAVNENRANYDEYIKSLSSSSDKYAKDIKSIVEQRNSEFISKYTSNLSSLNTATTKYDAKRYEKYFNDIFSTNGKSDWGNQLQNESDQINKFSEMEELILKAGVLEAIKDRAKSLYSVRYEGNSEETLYNAEEFINNYLAKDLIDLDYYLGMLDKSYVEVYKDINNYRGYAKELRNIYKAENTVQKIKFANQGKTDLELAKIRTSAFNDVLGNNGLKVFWNSLTDSSATVLENWYSLAAASREAELIDNYLRRSVEEADNGYKLATANYLTNLSTFVESDGESFDPFYRKMWGSIASTGVDCVTSGVEKSIGEFIKKNVAVDALSGAGTAMIAAETEIMLAYYTAKAAVNITGVETCAKRVTDLEYLFQIEDQALLTYYRDLGNYYSVKMSGDINAREAAAQAVIEDLYVLKLMKVNELDVGYDLSNFMGTSTFQGVIENKSNHYSISSSLAIKYKNQKNMLIDMKLVQSPEKYLTVNSDETLTIDNSNGFGIVGKKVGKDGKEHIMPEFLLHSLNGLYVNGGKVIINCDYSTAQIVVNGGSLQIGNENGSNINVTTGGIDCLQGSISSNNATINVLSDVSIEGGTWYSNGKVCTESVNSSGGAISIKNGSAWDVSENVNIVSSGKIEVHDGQMNVSGDFQNDNILLMDNEKSKVVVNGKFTMNGTSKIYYSHTFSSKDERYWKAGTIELRGDAEFGNNRDSDYYTLCPEENFVVLIDGDTPQTIKTNSSPDSEKYRFGTLRIDNPNVNMASAIGTRILDSSHDEIVMSDVQGLMVTRELTKNLIVNGSLVESNLSITAGLYVSGNVQGGSISLKGDNNQFHILGDYIAPKNIDVNANTVEVDGDCTIESGGILNMQNELGRFIVNGKFTMNGTSKIYYSHTFSSKDERYWKAGTIELRGDAEFGNNSDPDYYTLCPEENFVVLIDGDKPQTIKTISSPDSKKYRFGTLRIDNPNVSMASAIGTMILDSSHDEIVMSDTQGLMVTRELTKNLIVNGRLIEPNLSTTADLYVSGNVQGGSISLKGDNNQFHILGDYIAPKNIDVNANTVEVDGDCTIESGGILNMQNELGRFIVNGKFTMNGTSKIYYSHTFSSKDERYWKAGTIELRGDAEFGNNSDPDYYTLCPEENFVVLIDGDKPQTIKTKGSLNSERYRFEILQVENDQANLINVATKVLESTADEISIGSASGITLYRTLEKNLNVSGDLTSPDFSINADMEVKGNIEGGTLKLSGEGKKCHVAGDYIKPQSLVVGANEVNIDGSLLNNYINGIINMQSELGVINVGKTFETSGLSCDTSRSSTKYYFSAGTVNVYGDIVINKYAGSYGYSFYMDEKMTFHLCGEGKRKVLFNSDSSGDSFGRLIVDDGIEIEAPEGFRAISVEASKLQFVGESTSQYQINKWDYLSEVCCADANRYNFMYGIPSTYAYVITDNADGIYDVTCKKTQRITAQYMDDKSTLATYKNLGINSLMPVVDEPTRATLKFVGWKDESGADWDVNANVLTKDTILNAQWGAIDLEQIIVSEPEITIWVGKNVNLMYSFAPEIVTKYDIAFSSSDENVASINEEGVITGTGAGVATITVTDKYTNISADCMVTVMAYSPIVSLEYLVDGEEYYKCQCAVGDEVDLSVWPSKYGCTFDGWYYDESFENMVQTPLVVEDKLSLYGRFVNKDDKSICNVDSISLSPEEKFTIESVSCLTGDKCENTSFDIEDEDVAEIDENGTIHAKAEGETVVHIRNNDSGEEFSVSIEIVADASENREYVDVSLINEGDVEKNSIPVGSRFTKYNIPYLEGYAFQGWFINDSDEPYDFANPIYESIELTAKWTKEPKKAISFINTDIVLVIGDSYTLSDNISNTSDENITWSIDSDICHVEDGILFADKFGNARITVSTENGLSTAIANISVEKKEQSIDGEFGAQDESVEGTEDGLILYNGIVLNDESFEIRTENQNIFVIATEENTTNLAAQTYEIRKRENDEFKPSESIFVTVNPGVPKYEITFMDSVFGYENVISIVDGEILDISEYVLPSDEMIFTGWYYLNDNNEKHMMEGETEIHCDYLLTAEWKDYPSIEKVSIPKEILIFLDDEYTFDPSIVVSEPTNDGLQMSLSDSSSGVVAIVDLYTIKAEKCGYVDVIISSKKNPEVNAVCKVTVAPLGLWITIDNAEELMYSGKAIMPNVTVTDGKNTISSGTDYSVTYKNNVNAYSISEDSDANAPTIIVIGKGNYAGKETKTFSIRQRSIDDENVIVTPIASVIANGKKQNPIPTLMLNNKKLANGKDFKISGYKDINSGELVTECVNPGKYLVIVEGLKNFTGIREIPYEICDKAKVLISKVSLTKIASVEYTGDEICPEIKMTNSKKVPLVRSTDEGITGDYLVTYSNNIEIGTATVTITGINDYCGTRTATFSITGRKLSAVKITGIPKTENFTGNPIEPEVSLTYTTGKGAAAITDTLVKDKDYKVGYTNNTNPGTATITITGIGKYTGSVKKTFKIANKVISNSDQDMRISFRNVSIINGSPAAKYTKGGAKPDITVRFSYVDNEGKTANETLKEGTDYTVKYSNNTAVTTDATTKLPTVTVTGKGRFKGTITATYRIIAQDLSSTSNGITMTVPDKVVSNKNGAWMSTPVITDKDGKKLVAGKDYDKNYYYYVVDANGRTIENVTAKAKQITLPSGTYVRVTVYAINSGNPAKPSCYKGSISATYRIVGTDISKANISVKSKTYTGQAIKLDKSDITVKVGKQILPDDSYEIVESTYTNNVNKGKATVVIKGAGDCDGEYYGGEKIVTFTIGSKSFLWCWRNLMQ